MSIKVKDLKKGSILSETSYFTVVKNKGDNITVKDSNGNNLVIQDKYVEKILNSADQYLTEEKLSQTEVIQKFKEASRVACSVYFQKRDKKKTKKVFNLEISEWTNKVKKAFLEKGLSGLNDFATEPVLPYIKGEMRLMVGYHAGTTDDRGRIQFNDMEDPESFMKVVDTRTIEWFIANNVKYIVK